MTAAARPVTLIRGDGIGPEVADAVLAILEAARAPLAFEEVVVGREAEKREGDPAARAARSSRSGATASRSRARSARRSARVSRPSTSACARRSTLYANLRPGQERAGRREPLRRTSTSSSSARTPRTSTAASSTSVVPGVVESLKIITEAASTRIARFAFEYARSARPPARHGGPQGQHHEALRRALPRLLPARRRGVSRHRRRRPDRRRHVHAARHEPRDLRRPAAREPLRRHRLGPRGGPRRRARASCPGANLGSDAAIFEAVHGTAPDIAGQDKANPTALLHVGDPHAATPRRRRPTPTASRRRCSRRSATASRRRTSGDAARGSSRRR